MYSGRLVYKATLGRDKGKIVEVPVRECPDPAVARAAIERAFQECGGPDSVAWRPGSRR